MRDQLAGLDADLRNLGIAGINRLNRGSARSAFLVAGVIDDELVALLHVAQVLYGNRIGHSVPDGGLLFLQIGKAVNSGFGFKKVVGHGGDIISLLSKINHVNRASAIRLNWRRRLVFVSTGTNCQYKYK